MRRVESEQPSSAVPPIVNPTILRELNRVNTSIRGESAVVTTTREVIIGYVEHTRGVEQSGGKVSQSLEEFRVGYRAKRDAWIRSESQERPASRGKFLARLRQGRQPSNA